tara:strand:- start:1632 stop:1751 length:120 start_codon:yes stop_codon:yes gene_type:complete
MVKTPKTNFEIASDNNYEGVGQLWGPTSEQKNIHLILRQ